MLPNFSNTSKQQILINEKDYSIRHYLFEFKFTGEKRLDFDSATIDNKISQNEFDNMMTQIYEKCGKTNLFLVRFTGLFYKFLLALAIIYYIAVFYNLICCQDFSPRSFLIGFLLLLSSLPITPFYVCLKERLSKRVEIILNDINQDLMLSKGCSWKLKENCFHLTSRNNC